MSEILKALAKDLGVFSEAQEAAEGRDTSLAHWRFLGDVLRHMTEREPDVQAVIDPVIEGMDMMAAGEDWPKAQEAAWDLDSIEHIHPDRYCSAAKAAWFAAWAARLWQGHPHMAADAVIYFTAAVIPANQSHCVQSVKRAEINRTRQREALLRMIGECPIKGESE